MRRKICLRFLPLPIISGEQFAQQCIAFSVAISPRGIVKVTAQACRKLQGFSRLLVLRAGPSAHSPKSVPDFADFKSRSSRLSIFHLIRSEEHTSELQSLRHLV